MTTMTTPMPTSIAFAFVFVENCAKENLLLENIQTREHAYSNDLFLVERKQIERGPDRKEGWNSASSGPKGSFSSDRLI
jgi:hypothetical protein